jgi:hypothetical protein
LSALPPPPPPPPPPSLPGSPTYYRPYNVWAIVSISFAASTVLGTWFFGGLVAVVTGHVARHQIKRSGEAGAGLALGGLIAGYIAIGLFIAFVTAYIAFFALFFSYVTTHPFPTPSPSASP